jgi:hypothetical protein
MKIFHQIVVMLESSCAQQVTIEQMLLPNTAHKHNMCDKKTTIITIYSSKGSCHFIGKAFNFPKQ